MYLIYSLLFVPKVEVFKTDQQPHNSLACKFNIHSAEVIKDQSYHDMQVNDCILRILPLLLALAELIST